MTYLLNTKWPKTQYCDSLGVGFGPPLDEASMELIGGAEKGDRQDTTSQRAQVASDEAEEDSGRGSASTALAVNFNPRYTQYGL